MDTTIAAGIMPPHPAIAQAMVHGGRLEAIGRAFPNAPKPWIDLSTGINPVPYPIPILRKASFTRLPEPEAVARLQAAASAAYGLIDPAMAVAAPGTQILIDLLPRLLRLDRVAILGPTYGEHEAAWRRAGSTVTPIRTIEDLTDQNAHILCNPNNPDGRIIPPATLLACADRLAGQGGTLIVDEAFADLTPDVSLARFLPHPAIIVLRSFGKTYGLAGVRLGFALAAPARAAFIAAALGPWAVSGAALAIGEAALTDMAWLAATKRRLLDDVESLDRLLAASGLTVIGGTSLFRLVASPKAHERFIRCAQAGILTRAFEAEGTWLRFGIPGTRAAWRRLRATLRAGVSPDHEA